MPTNTKLFPTLIATWMWACFVDWPIDWLIETLKQNRYSCGRHSDFDSENKCNQQNIVIVWHTHPLPHTHPQTNAKGGVAAWPDVPKPGATLGNLTPADRHGSVQVSRLWVSIIISYMYISIYVRYFLFLSVYTYFFKWKI